MVSHEMQGVGGVDFRLPLAARAAHEVNRTVRSFLREEEKPHWDESSPEDQDSIYAGIDNVMKNPDLTPEQSHESWLAARRELGWTYGAVQDDAAKIHPCLVDYKYLPAMQRLKDQLFVTTVKTIMGL